MADAPALDTHEGSGFEEVKAPESLLAHASFRSDEDRQHLLRPPTKSGTYEPSGIAGAGSGRDGSEAGAGGGAGARGGTRAPAIHRKASAIKGSMPTRDAVLLAVPQWNKYVRAGSVSMAGRNLFLEQDDVDALDEYEGVPPESMEELVDDSGASVAQALVKVMKSITSVRVLRYALTLAEELLTYDAPKRVQLFVSDSGSLPTLPLFRCLEMEDAYLQRQAAVVLAHMLRVRPEMEATASVLTWALRLLRLPTSSPSSLELAAAVSCLAILLRNHELREEFRDAHGIERLLPVLKTTNTQMLYEATFCFWALSFDANSRRIMLDCGVVKALACNRATVRTKVLRVAVAALTNVAMDEEVGKTCLTIMCDSPLEATLQKLEEEHKLDDEDMKKDVVFLREQMEKTNLSHSPFDRYCRELNSGLLDWSAVHTVEFWRANARRFEVRDYALLRRLGELLTISMDTQTVAVACYDLGEFARHHPSGRIIMRQLGLKARLMAQLAAGDAEVKKQALLACSKLMVESWQFLEDQRGAPSHRAE